MAGTRPGHHGDPHLRTLVAAVRPDRRRRARRHPRPAGDGVRRTRRSPTRHRPLHHHRLPGGLRAHGTLTRAGPRTRLVGVAADLRRHRAPRRRRRRPGDGDRARRDDGRDGRPDPDRSRCGQARLRRRPAVEGGPGRLHERPRHHDLRRPAPQARGVLDRRRRVRRRVAGLRRRLPRPEPDRAVVGSHDARRPPAASSLHQDDPCGARGRHRRDGGHRSVRSRHLHGRHPPRGAPDSVTAVDERERRRTDDGRRRRHHPRLAHRHHRDVDGVRGTTRRGGEARPGDDRDRFGQHRGRLLPGFRRVDEQLTHRRGRSDRRQEPAHRSGGCRHGRAAPAVLQRAPQESPADRARRRRDRSGILTRRPSDTAPLPEGPPEFVHALARRHGRCGLLRSAAGHPHRRGAVDPAVLQAQLVAPR